MRKTFWNVDRVNNFYKNKLKETHSHFYQSLIPGRTEERTEAANRLKRGGFIKAMNLVDGDITKKAKKKVKVIKFDSGSDGESHQDNSGCQSEVSNSDKDSFDSRVSINLTYKPTIITKQADFLDKAEI